MVKIFRFLLRGRKIDYGMLERDNSTWSNSNCYSEEEDKQLTEKYNLEEKRKDRKFKMTMSIIFVFCILYLIYAVIGTIIVKTSNIMNEIDYNQLDYITIKNNLKNEYNNINVTDMTISDIKKQAGIEVPLTWCIQIDRPHWAMGDKGGTCSFLIGLIRIDDSLNVSDYTKALVHERLHLYYYTGCERFIQYQTFRFLYESENLFFHKVGVEIAIQILENKYPEHYNCTGQIIEYFIERG